MIPSHQIRGDLGAVNEKDRTVELTWSTGSKGLRYIPDFGPAMEELSMNAAHVNMERLNSETAPVLDLHNRFSLDGVIGVVERAWLENGKGKALVRFSEVDPNADKVFKKIKERVLRNVSVGYSVEQYQDVSLPGDKIPTLRAIAWTPKEISIVPIGFDANARTRSEEKDTNEVEIIQTRSQTSEKEETMKVKTPEEMAAEAAISATPVASPVDVEALKIEASKAGASAERTRISEINAAVRAANLEDSFAQDMVTRGLNVAEASKEIFKKLEEKSAKT